MNEKGAETFWIIVGAVLAITVLIILIAITVPKLTAGGKKGGEALAYAESCTKGLFGTNKCLDLSQQDVKCEGEIISAPPGGWNDCEAPKVCCKKG